MSQRNTRINRGQISSIDVDDLWATNSPTDTQVPSYDLATGKFKWINIGGIASNIDTDESGVSVQDSLDLKLEDAPSDDTIYGRQNGSWVEVSGGDAVWGDITGTLSDQEDLQDELDLKANLTDLLASEIDTDESGVSVQDKLDEIELGIGLFEIDINGGLMPITETLPDNYYELDVNDDIMPKIA